jgi:hypothetical protein
MLTGKQFKLLKSTPALDGVSNRGWVSIPAGAVVEVVAEPRGSRERLVELLWEGHAVSVFASDLKGSQEITSYSAARKPTSSGYGSTGAA